MVRTVDVLYITTTIIKKFKDNSPKGFATGFFFGTKNDELYLVTNKHVIYGYDYWDPDAEPEIDKLVLVLHTSANLSENEEVEINLIESGRKIWLEHFEPTIDVILIPIKLDLKKYFVVYVGKSSLDWSQIKPDIAEKVFMMGYPHAWYDEKNNLPIVRVGHLSSPFGIGFKGEPYMLADVETHPGMSGSPVFMKLHNYITASGDMMMGGFAIRLVGIFSGPPWISTKNPETGDDEEVSHTLCRVWFGNLIMEILEKNEHRKKEQSTKEMPDL